MLIDHTPSPISPLEGSTPEEGGVLSFYHHQITPSPEIASRLFRFLDGNSVVVEAYQIRTITTVLSF